MSENQAGATTTGAGDKAVVTPAAAQALPVPAVAPPARVEKPAPPAVVYDRPSFLDAISNAYAGREKGVGTLGRW